MLQTLITTVLTIAAFAAATSAQVDVLQREIQQIIAGKRATVGVSIADANGRKLVSINGEKHLPMQSVFKFHIAAVVLSEVDKGKLSLDQNIEITKKELIPGLYSPIHDAYPNGVTLPISKILEYTVSQSDNVGC